MKIVILLLGIFCFFSAMGQTPIPTDLYMSFPLDGNATDVGGSNHTGTIVGGVTATTDRFGNVSKAMQFNGTTGFIDIPYATSVGTLDFSVSYWANPNTANAGFVFTKEQSAVATNQFRMGSSGDYFGCFSDITNTYGGGLAYVPTTNVWSFYTITRQGASIKLYVNGVYQSALNTAGTINHSNTLDYRIGAVYSGSTYFNGKIDDLRMFQHALSTDEIAALYAYSGTPVITSFAPVSGAIGTSVTITGSGFSTTPANNIVYFGAVKATVNSSSSTSITVTAPAGAGSIVPVSVTVNNHVAYSTSSSTPTFNLTNSPNLSMVYQKTANAVGTNPRSVAIGDFNGDGKADMAIANAGTNSVSVLYGNGNGTFGIPVTYGFVSNTPYSITIGDFNGDGKPDLAIANYGSHNVSVLLNTGDGNFGSVVNFPVGQNPKSVAVGDFNSDGIVDLVTANSVGRSISVLLGIGDGTFAAKSDSWIGFTVNSVAVGNFNSDGKADLVCSDDNNHVNILLGNNNGTFATPVIYSVVGTPQTVAIGDFNGDGKADLATANQSTLNVSVLLGNGNGTFAAAVNYPVGSKPYSIAVGDFNGDGKADLVVSNIYEYSFSISIIEGNGDGTFMPEGNYPLESISYSVAVGDFNGDGKADLVTTDYNTNTLSILLNAAISISTQVTDISVITATGNGTISDFGILNQASAHGVCWKKTGIPIILDNKVELGATSTTGTFSASMTGFTYNTTYYVRAYAINTAGTSYGNVVSFTTLPHPPLKITSFAPVTGTIGTSVIISGVGFSTIPSENIVYFGTVKATVTASTSTSLTVIVPAGAGSVVPVSVTVQSAIAYSTTSSTPTFTLTNSPNLSLVYAKTDIAVGGNGPESVAVGDFNGDGKADMATANNYSDNVGIMLGNGSGGFAAAVNYPAGSSPRSVTVGDFNGDGKADLCTANTNNSTISILIGNGDGTFTATSSCFAASPESVAVGDFNGDGKADLACSNYTDGVDILLGNGDGTFASVVNYSLGSYSRSVTIGDFNRDGKADVAATINSNNVGVLLGNGNGGFAAAVNYPVGNSPYSIATGDFNNDGKADLATANYSSDNVSVLLGNGSGSFAVAVNYPAGSNPRSIAVGDFNGDGKTDLIANGGYDNVSVMLGNGSGAFAASINYPVGSNPNSIAVGDFNGDGKADIVTANFDSNNASVMLNAFIGISTQAATGIGSTTATGNGNIIDLGIISPSAHGVCWNTTGSPTISDSKIDKGAASATGPFTASMAGLATNTKYYVRAYATNSIYTSYGNEINFTTLQPPVVKITSFSPVSGPVGTTVTLTGIGFSTNPTENIVYFGAVRASVSASTAASITATVPAGAGSVVPVSVTVYGAIAYSSTSSTPTFNLTNTPNLDLVYRKTDVAVGVNNPVSTAIGDFNRDGKADLATANAASNSVSILLGDGNGGFAPAVNYLVSISPRSVVVGDFNSDGKADLATAHFGSNAVSILIGNGNGEFATPVNYATGSGGISIACDDFNGDQKADLITANYNLNTVSVLLGNGNGGFAAHVQYLAGTNPISVAVGDFNKDTWADLAIADYGSGKVSILLGNGNGSFATAVQYSVGMNPWSVNIGDFNQDGNVDLAVANNGSNTVSVLLGTGTGSFGTAVDFPTGTSPLSISVGDFNGDGKADLAVANNSSNDVCLLIGNGNGGFASPVNFQSGSSPYAVAVGDFNGDGKADLATANSASNNVTVLLNVKLIVSTQAVSNIGETTATGNGNIIELGIPNPTAYGVCWNTTGAPTISDYKVDKGTASVSGPFTASITGLTVNTRYYVRAFATNTAGTTYGNEVSFSSHGTYTWSGNSSGEWNNATNWLPNQMPGNSDDVIIPSGVANWPVFTGNFVLGSNCRNLTLNAGTQLTITSNITLNNGFTLNNNGLLKVGGNWINNRDASFNTGNGTVEFFGSTTSSITPFTGAMLYKINDNFNTFPGNWLGDIGSDQTQFKQVGGTNAGGSSPEIMFEGSNLPGINTRRLYQVVNTTGLNALLFQFKQTIIFGPEFTLKVEYSINGTNWFDAGWSVTPTGDIYGQTVNVNLNSSQGVGSATYYISITVTGNLNTDFVLYFDDVKLMYNDQNEVFYNLTCSKANNLLSSTSGNINVSNNLIVKPGAWLTISTGSALNVTGTMTLESDATGTASYIDNGTTNLNGGAFVQRYLTASKWHLLSSPVSGQSIPALVGANPFATNGVKYGLAPYNNSLATPNWVPYTTATLAGAGNFTVGKGYEAMVTAPTSLAFTGTLVNTNQSVPVTAGTNNWNLIGNPFPSSLYANNPASAINNIINVNSAIFKSGYSALYVWDPETALYRIINHATAATYIQSGQGFFINVAAGGTASLTAAMRTHSAAPFYKGTESEWPGFDLNAAISGTNSTTQILFVPGTTVGLDEGYDAGMYSAGSTEKAIYTQIEGSKVDFGLQCLPENAFDKNIIPVGLNAPEGSNVFFTANTHNLPSNIKVYIEDRNEGKFTRLDESGSLYAIKLITSSSGTGRFYLHTSSTLLNVSNDKQEVNFTIIPLPKENKIRIIGKVCASSVASVYTISGQLLGSFNLSNSADNEISFSPKANGVYLLKVQSGGTVVTRKIIWVE